jgi:hypothetical protein
VVEHGDIGGQDHGDLGHVDVAEGVVGEPLPAAHRVVADGTDQAGGQRREARDGLGGQSGDGVADRFDRVAAGGDAHGRIAEPDRLAVTLGESRAAGSPDDRVAAPDPAVLGRLQQEGAEAAAREATIEPQRRLAVGEEPAHDRHDAAVLREDGEGLQARPGVPVGQIGGFRGHRWPPAVVAVGTAATAPRSLPSKQVRVPMWQAAPT